MKFSPCISQKSPRNRRTDRKTSQCKGRTIRTSIRIHKSASVYPRPTALSLHRRTHLIEIRNLSDIYQIDHSKVLDLLRDSVECFVHGHALGVPVVAKADDDDSVFFGFNGFIDVP